MAGQAVLTAQRDVLVAPTRQAPGLPTRMQVRTLEAEGVIAIKRVINRQTGEGEAPIFVAVPVSEVT